MRRLRLLFAFATTPLAGCDVPGEVGDPCGPPDVVEAYVARVPGRVEVVTHADFECISATCVRVGVDEAVCTTWCASDAECGAMACADPVVTDDDDRLLCVP